MYVIGLTGSIGSGKTTVANLFAERGIPVVDADLIAREVTQPHTPAYDEIVARFGNAILKADNSIDRCRLREIIFTQSEERLWLEALLHPIILKRMQEDIARLSAPYVLAVIPLLLEVDGAEYIQRILVVDVPDDIQLQRAALRDNSTHDHIKSIIKTQVSRAERLSRADDIINNAGTPEDLVKQVENLHQLYLKLGQK